MKRPVLIAIIGYIIGILWGLYLKINIALFYFSIFFIYHVNKKILENREQKSKFKLLSIKRYFRYIKLIVKPNIIFIFISFSIISNTIVYIQEYKYEKVYRKEGKIILTGIVISQKEEKTYYDRYKIKITHEENEAIFKNKYVYIQTKKEDIQEYAYGDKIEVYGEYSKVDEQRNYGGFDYQQYLKTKKICGVVNVSKIRVLKKKEYSVIMIIANKINTQIKSNIDKSFKKQEAEILKGLLLGDVSKIEEEIKENFKTANMMHILAISGMHINYIILGIDKFLNRKIGKRNTNIVIIIILIIYMFVAGFSPSIVRAIVMGALGILSFLLHRKNDIWTSISISLFCILIYNPYSIMDIGLQLSYFGTIGIIIFNPVFKKIFNREKKKSKFKIKNKYINKCINKVKEIIGVSLSAQVAILPLILYHFNIFGPYFLFSNFLISLIIGPVVVLGFVLIILSFVHILNIKILSRFLEIGVQVLIQISKISKLPFSKIYIPTPNIKNICIYYISLIIIRYIFFLYNSIKVTTTQRRMRNLLSLFKYKIYLNKKNYIKKIILIVFVTGFIFICIPKKLIVNFIDVGQGDCTFIITPKNKTILVDGGGNDGKFDIGKNVLLPYILDMGYGKIDYIIISHFDSDHCAGLLSLMEEIKVKNVIIGTQYKSCDNYEKFIEIVKKKKINVIVVEAGNIINIEKNLYFNVVAPFSNNMIPENPINNNSLVCKLNYKEISILFTGDIEAVAEKTILNKYKQLNSNLLKSTILKVAHHGSKTSSLKEFLEEVNPKYAIIGVGKDNKFGHPSEDTIQNLKLRNVKIYRTDNDGEISIVINGKNIKVNKHIKNK